MYRTQGMSVTDLRCQRTLASDFVISISGSCWNAYEIKNVTSHLNAPEGEMAVTSLHSDMTGPMHASFSLSGILHQDDLLEVQVEHGTKTPIADYADLIAILSRVLAQWIIEKLGVSEKLVAIQLPNEALTDRLNLHAEVDVLKLFHPLIPYTEHVELSEMVDQDGTFLGMVPRKLVHATNLLHRGVGMVITKDQPILQPRGTKFPDLYTHRRTDCKRIFPSLYDMFVGGVSIAREEARMTAAREVAEELGLERALQDPTNTMLSDPLFECIVCTSYNRCFVTVFCCTFDSTKDTITWQEDEVAWGAFVPYDVIVSSADLSIQRLINSDSWPAKIPANMENRVCKALEVLDLTSKDWDYVPDGLLVWEAWLQWQAGIQ